MSNFDRLEEIKAFYCVGEGDPNDCDVAFLCELLNEARECVELFSESGLQPSLDRKAREFLAKTKE